MKKNIKRILGKLYCFIFGIKNCGKNVYICLHSKIVNGNNIEFSNNVSIMPYNMIVSHGNGKIKIGENSEIGMYSRIASQNSITIEKEVITGPNIFIADYNHEYRDIYKPIMEQGNTKEKNEVIIGEGSWIGTNVVIVGNVKIGKHVVIGANSVVLKDIADYSVATGAPAKIVKKYNFNSKKWIKE